MLCREWLQSLDIKCNRVQGNHTDIHKHTHTTGNSTNIQCFRTNNSNDSDLVVATKTCWTAD